MGKGGCNRGAPVGSEGDHHTGKVTLDSLIGALQSVTSTRWAHNSISRRPVVKEEKAKAAPTEGCGAISWDEVKQHSHAESCWIVVHNKVYDVTQFAPNHPGGKAILAYGGRDASDVFAAFHASGTQKILRQFCIGEVEGTEADPMLSDFRRLRSTMMQAGLFKSSLSYYAWKVISLLSMFLSVAVVLLHGSSSWASCLAAACLLGITWQQSGWLAHDFLHHQVFKRRHLNNAVGYFLGCLLQGFSVDWWKNKHNMHHAVPNECTDDGVAVDPDIDTLPLLAWHEDMVRDLPPSAGAIIKYQHYLFFPILCFARLVWAQQSASHAFMLSQHSWRGVLETTLIGLHYAIFLGMPLVTLPVAKALAFLALSQMFAGFLLALVFVQSHNGMEVYMEKKDFVSAQIVSTRNINSTLWMDWFTGGLNFQIEHHLFPTLPRHNLKRAQELVKRFCKDRGFVYEMCGMDTGTYRVLSRLADVAAAA